MFGTPSADDPGTDLSDGDLDFHPRSRLPIILAVVGLLGAAAAAAYFALRRPALEPTRVLVAVETRLAASPSDAATAGSAKGGEVKAGGGASRAAARPTRGAWWGAHGRASARIADALGKQLKELGLDVVPAGADSTLAALDGARGEDGAVDLLAAARSLGARWVVGGVADAEAVTRLDEHAVEVTVRTELVLRGAAQGDPAEPLTPARWVYAEGPDAQEALLSAANDVARWATPQLAAVLAGRPDLARLRPGAAADPPLSPAEARAAEVLEPLFSLARRRGQHLEALAKAEADGVAWERRHRLHGATRLGPFLGEEYFVGRAGDGVVLLTVVRQRDLLPGRGDLTAEDGHERIVWAQPDGQGRRVLLDTYNVFSFPSVSADGRWMSAVVEHRGRDKALVVVDVATAQPREVLREPSRYLSSPVLSPKGAAVAYWGRACYRCASGLEVVAVPHGDAAAGAAGSGATRAAHPGPRVLIPPREDNTYMTLPQWAPDEVHLYLGLDPDGRPPSIWRVDTRTGEREPVLGPAARLVERKAGADRAARAADPGDGGPVGEPPPWAAEGVGFTFPTMAPDGGSLLVLEVGRRPDFDSPRTYHLGRLMLGAGGGYERVVELDARRVAFSPDGARVAYQVRAPRGPDDPDGGDLEIGVLDLASRRMTLLTRNDRDDELGGWSPRGDRVYFRERAREPKTKLWDSRVYSLAAP